MSHKPSLPVGSEIGELPRRSFLSRALAAVVGGLVMVLPLAPAVLYFLDPLTRKKRAVGMGGDAIDADGYIKITSESAVGEQPRMFKVVADLQDFWNKFPKTDVGSVYLRKVGDDVTCFNARCPHLGCTVKYEANAYVCPCHESAFSLDGKRTNKIPPRNMDELECRVVDGIVQVKFEKFRAGIHEKVPV